MKLILDAMHVDIKTNVGNTIEDLVETLQDRYNSVHFEQYTHEDGSECIAIGELTVAVFDTFAMNQTKKYIEDSVLAFCDLNIQLIRNESKKEAIKQLKFNNAIRVKCSVNF